jgi:hypothetical protein
MQVVFEFDPEGDDSWGDATNRYYAGYAARGDEMRFSMPEGKYRGLMFLGMEDGLRLLAVGVITGVKGADGEYIVQNIESGLFNLAVGVRTIEFSVQPIKSDIENGSLAFTSPTAYVSTSPKGYSTLVDGGLVPYFHVPPRAQADYGDADAIAGTFSFKGFPLILSASAVDLTDTSPIDTSGWLGLARVADLDSMIQTIGVFAKNRKTGVKLAPVPITGTVETVGLEMGALKIGFGLKTYDDPTLMIGFNKIQFFATVQAFKDGLGAGDRGEMWRIANGFEAASLDTGGVSLGQNILLLVGEPKGTVDLVDIVVSGVAVEEPPYFYVSSGGSDDVDVDGSIVTPFATLERAYEAAAAHPNRKTVAVLDDLTPAQPIYLQIDQSEAVIIKGAAGVTPTITTSDADSGEECVIYIENGAKIIFRNITIDGQAVDTEHRALSIYGNGTRVTLENGTTLKGYKNTGTGGAVCVYDGQLIMKDGEIIDSQALGGGGVVVTHYATFTMSGGKISGNVATGNSSFGGGGVNVSYYSKFNMSGGEISGNTSGFKGGGVYIDANSEFNMSGDSIVYGLDEITLKNSIDTYSTSAEGAAVYIYPGATSTVTTADNTVRFIDNIPQQ